MKIAQFIMLSTICGAAVAFVPLSQPRNPTIPAALDPSLAADPILVGAAGAAVAAIGAAVVGLGKAAGGNAASKEVAKPEKVDLSIPYDAAATLAFNSYAESSTTKVSFNQFKPLFEAQRVAQVKAKSQVEKVNEKKASVGALQKELAALEGDLASLDTEAADYKSQIQELFGTA